MRRKTVQVQRPRKVPHDIMPWWYKRLRSMIFLRLVQILYYIFYVQRRCWPYGPLDTVVRLYISRTYDPWATRTRCYYGPYTIYYIYSSGSARMAVVWCIYIEYTRIRVWQEITLISLAQMNSTHGIRTPARLIKTHKRFCSLLSCHIGASSDYTTAPLISIFTNIYTRQTQQYTARTSASTHSPLRTHLSR